MTAAEAAVLGLTRDQARIVAYALRDCDSEETVVRVATSWDWPKVTEAVIANVGNLKTKRPLMELSHACGEELSDGVQR